MLAQDRVFLKDFISLTFKNHLMTVEALFRSGQRASEFAVLTLRRANPELTQDEACKQEAQLNEAARFQAVMFAKIFAEYVAALEDFGALCLAVRQRNRRGMLREYFASETAAVANFYDEVLANESSNLVQMLDLPDFAPLVPGAPDSDKRLVEQHSSQGAKLIRDLARIYREPAVGQGQRGLAPLREDWRECAHFLVGVAGDGGKRARGVFAQVYNKIKHRFAMIEDVEAYASLPAADAFEVVTVDKRDERVALLVDATRHACMAAAEIAATLMFLDEHDLV